MKHKIIGICVCMLLAAATVLPVAGNINIEKKQGLIKSVESYSPPKQSLLRPLLLPSWLLALINPDWDCWSNTPNMFSIPAGNVGIGTNNPSAKLDVAGNIAVNGHEIIDASGNWVGNTTEKLPITAKWRMESNQYGPGFYLWEVTLFNTNPEIFYLLDDANISVNISGYYEINVNVEQKLEASGPGQVFLLKKGTVVLESRQYVNPEDLYNMPTHHFTDIEYLNAGENISVWSGNPNSYRWGGLLDSSISIILLS